MIDYKSLSNIISNFLQLRSALYQDDIDPLSSQLRNERLGFHELDSLMHYLDQKKYGGFMFRIADLLKTPRLLKMSLRRTEHAWEILHGEIDFDDLLAVNVLRFAAPEAFDFILENINEIRSLQVIRSEEKERIDNLNKKWIKVVDSVRWDVKAAEGLLTFLFPKWDISGQSIFIGSNVNPPQGLRHSMPVDYWLRVNLEDLSEVKVRDQEALLAITLWKSDNVDRSFRGLSLPEALYVLSDLCELFEHFSKIYLDGNDFRNIATNVFKLIVDKDGIGANSDSSAAFLSLWRLSLDSPIDEEAHIDWLLEEIHKYMPKSLRFVNSLYHYWRYSSRTSLDMKRFNYGVRESLIEEAKKIFSDYPNALLKVLDKNNIYNIYHLAVLYSLPEQGGKGFAPSEWKWLASVLLEAAEEQPHIALPQLIAWIFEMHPGVFESSEKYIFKDDWSKQLFGDKLQSVMGLIDREADFSHLKIEEQNLISFAQKTAKDWLQKHK